MTFVHSEKAIENLKRLREAGYSLNELVQKFSIPKTTIWHHIRHVKIKEDYRTSLRGKRGGSKKRSLQEWSKAMQYAKNLMSRLNKSNKILILSCLYWGEGSKRDFQLSNTDPVLIRTFIHCLEALGITRDRLSVNLRIYEDINKQDAIKFWAQICGIPESQISFVTVLKGKKVGKLLFGMCRVRITKGGYALKVVQSIQGIIRDKI